MILDSGNLIFARSYLNVLERERWLEKADCIAKVDYIISAFNMIGCDGFNVGNLDLAEGEEYLLAKAKLADFPFLSANLRDKASGELLFDPYIIKKIDDLRIGVFGLIPNRFQSNPVLLMDDPFETAKRIVAEMKESCDVIIALSNLGINHDRKLAQQVPDINIIVDGVPRLERIEPLKINNTIIIQSYYQGRYLGRLDLTIRNGLLDFHDASSNDAVQSEAKAEKSQYVNTFVSMDDSVEHRPDVQELVDEYKQLRMELFSSRPSQSETADTEE